MGWLKKFFQGVWESGEIEVIKEVKGIIFPYSAFQTENTIEFVKYLKEQRPGKRLAIFWKGASYHNSQQFREYLMLINQEKPEEKSLINCTLIYSECPRRKLCRRYLLTNPKVSLLNFIIFVVLLKQLSGYLNFLQMVKYLILPNFFSFVSIFLPQLY